MSVTISDRTRKILWAKAGGRCSICRELLVTEGTDADDPSVFGQEAHIIAEAPNGPRHADLPEYDVYENLILLCSKHHKKVDDQVVYYTTARLKEVKRDHENWVVSLGDRAGRLLPEPGYLIIRDQDGDPTSRPVISVPEGEDVGCWITQPNPGTPFWFRAGPGRNFDTVGQLADGQRVYGSREGVMRGGATWYLLRRNDKDWAWGNGEFLRPVTGEPSIARPAVGDTQPPAGLPGRAFISYVREDAQQVDQLQEILEQAGIRVWRDTADIWPGQDWKLAIRDAITTGSLVFLACFSKKSQRKGNSYQNEELNLAVGQMRLRQPGIPWLIPVRFDRCSLPSFDLGGGRMLDSLQCADLFGPNYQTQAERLVLSIQRILAG